MTPAIESASQHRRLPFRADIEGLRAIAILLVVAAHADVPWLAGGFVGVDVFFVLSGYLITGLLAREATATGTIGFANFYARRFRRLMPGLLLMLACTGLAAWLLVAPADQPAQAMAAVSAAAWLSNFHFAFSDLGYFTPGAETNLYLHTWSLGVEEQFYLAWPALLVLSLGAWKGSRLAARPERLKTVLVATLVTSLLASLWWTRTEPLLAFYMMPARAWQFALGALIFLQFGEGSVAARENDTPRAGARLLPAAGWLGLGMILVASVVLDAQTPYPGTWALLPSIGTAAVLAAGTQSSPIGVGRLLSLRPMQGIGRVSYAWYLWHWPVLLLGANVLRPDIAGNRLGLVALSFVLALASYYWVESPLRRQVRLVARPRIAVAGAFACMIIAASIGLRWHNHAGDRLKDPDQLPFQAIRYDAPAIYAMPCDDWYHSADVKPCIFGSDDAPRTAVIMGDSIGLQWFPAFAKAFEGPDWRLLVLTKSSCPMVDVPIFYPRIGRVFTECGKWRRDALQYIATIKPDIVVLGSTDTYDYSMPEWVDGTSRVLEVLSGHARQVAILRSTPLLPFDGPSCLAPRSRIYSALVGTNRCSASARSSHGDDVLESLRVAASRFANVSVVDMTDVVCPQGECHAELDDRIVFRDSRHLSASFVESLSGDLRTRLAPADHGLQSAR